MWFIGTHIQEESCFRSHITLLVSNEQEHSKFATDMHDPRQNHARLVKRLILKRHRERVLVERFVHSQRFYLKIGAGLVQQMVTAVIPGIYSRKPSCNCRRRWKRYSKRLRHMRRQLSISVAIKQEKINKIAKVVRKRKCYFEINDTLHAQAEQSHREKIFRYQGRRVCNTVKYTT